MKKQETRGERVIRFIETFCKVPEGDKVGQRLRLLDFQKRFILEVYDNPAGTRRAYLSIGRKNGKTALIACILLAHLVGPEARLNSQIVSGARSREQASLVFKLACKMIGLSAELAKITRIVPSSKTLHGLRLNTEFRALAADGSKAQGLSPIVAILDEVGQVRGPSDDFVEAIVTAQGAHSAPLLFAISTQAPSDADLFSEWLDDAATNADPTIVSHCYEAPKDCDVLDEDAWKAANPALSAFRSLDDMRKQAEQAARMPSRANSFRNLLLNQRVNTFSPFVTRDVWNKGNRGLPDFGNAPIYAGLDLSATTDLTAFVMVARIGGELVVQPHFWMPEDNVEEATKRDHAPYDVWVKQGLLRVTPGPTIDYEFVANDIAKLTNGLNIAGLAFDRWRMDRLRGEFERIGLNLPLVEFGQGYANMSPAVEALEVELLNGRVVHAGHPVLAMCASNAKVASDPAGNRKFEKSKSTGRIDGLVALTMAVGTEFGTRSSVVTSPYDDPSFSMFATGS